MTPTFDFSVPNIPSMVVYNPKPNAMTVTMTGRVLPGRQAALVPAADPIALRLLKAKLLVESKSSGTAAPEAAAPAEVVAAEAPAPKSKKSKHADPKPEAEVVADEQVADAPAEVPAETETAVEETAVVAEESTEVSE